MKRLIVLLVVLTSFSTTSKASHVLGGEMGWRCLPTGKYQFFMNTYRDCTGISFTYEDEEVTIVGSPLPKDATGRSFDKITLKPDSNRWLSERNGDTSPTCTNQYGNANTCDNGDKGSVQQFFYRSDPITLAGNPNRAGWKFYWESVCCRPGQVANVNTNGTMLLRAEMYRTKDAVDKDPCIDSSPEFKSLPTSAICRGYEFTFNSTAIDPDLDSLIYSWDRPYNPPYEAPVALTYKAGFSPTNPTPDKTFDIKNIPATLGALSGIINMAIYSGVATENFITVIKVDSYRDGAKISSVYREIPISAFSCPALPNGKTNNPPEVFIDGVSADGLIMDITAGQEIRLPIQVKDLDVTGIGTQLQTVTLVPDGLLFSRDRTIGVDPTKPGTPCQVTFGAGKNLVVEPCAYLQNKTPFLDNGTSPPEYKISGPAGVSTEFVWQTDCAHIQTKTGVPGTNVGIYNFVMRVSDDHCPIPAINYPTITVRVNDPVPLTEPIMKGINVDLKGEITYQWVPAIDSAFTFEKYIVQEIRTIDGQPPIQWNPLNNNLKDFQQEKKNVGYQIHRNVIPTDPTSPRNILQKIADRDWYMRMITVSGCTDDVESPASDAVRIIEPSTTASAAIPNPPRSEVTITWNRPKAANAKTYPYFRYESPTHFYVWENDSISNGGVGDAANWYLRGNTKATTYSVASNVCQDYVAFRIEARDTVITWKQGNAPSPRIDSLDTLVFSTFSVIDTMYMVTPGRVPRPKLDTIEVKANGDIYIRGDRAAAGTAGTFKIYNSVVDPDSLLATLDLEIEDSVLIPGQNANGKTRKIIIESIDRCNTTVTEQSFVYTTILPTGQLFADCPPFYRLTWNAPTGFNAAIKSYKILVDETGTGNNFVQVASNDGSSTTYDHPVIEGLNYLFKVIATDNEDAVNISASHSVTIPTGLRTNEIPPSPSLRCAFVEDDGSVTVSFIPPGIDPTQNGTTYRFEYRRDNGAWQAFAGSGNVFYDKVKDDGEQGDTAVRITGIDAQTARYDFRAAINGGCDGVTPSPWSNVMSSIFIEATAVPNDPAKKGDIEWNSTQVDYGQSLYSLFKDTFNLRYSTTPLNPFLDATEFLDESNGLVCLGNFNYYVTIEDEFSKCVSRSNIDSALYEDNFPPDPVQLNYITYDLITGGLRAYWTRIINDTDSLFFTTTDGFNSGLQAYKSLGAEDYRAENYLIPFTTLDARDSAVVVGAIAQDGCGNRSSETDLMFHKSIDVEVQWNVCDSSMNISWNAYQGFNEDFDVVYEVWFDSTGNILDANKIAESEGSLDSTYNHKIEVGDKTYSYYVKASSKDPAAEAFESTSNVDSDYAIYEDVPRYGYLTFATVEDDVVKLEYYKDTLINVKGYNIYRGTDANFMNPIGFIDYQTVKDDQLFDFIDANVDVTSFSYFYKIQILNACDEPVDTSNFGRSILLNVNPDNEAVTNTLRWNEYVEWDSTVAYYNIYRGVDAMPTSNVYAVVPPSNSPGNLYVDDVYDELFSIGKFCYKVEAVQGQVTDEATSGFPNNLNPATSNSNIVCITQEPLFYVPNAFAPDGINNTFGPKGQFFDFSLYEMVIFNRWGEEVYRTRDINKGWNGTHNGKDAQLGSYVYTIRFIDADGDEHRRKGTVTLVK